MFYMCAPMLMGERGLQQAVAAAAAAVAAAAAAAAVSCSFSPSLSRLRARFPRVLFVSAAIKFFG